MISNYFICSNKIHCLTLKIPGKLAYEFALQLNKDISTFLNTNKEAGYDWIHGFMVRHTFFFIKQTENHLKTGKHEFI